MYTSITNGVKITVKSAYQPLYSNALNTEYVFSYTITIENLTEFSIKLLSRHWFIFNGYGNKEEVKGEGVIGQQPIIEPNKVYQYTSGCNLATPIGKMYGNYKIERLFDGKILIVKIPEFTLITPNLLN